MRRSRGNADEKSNPDSAVHARKPQPLNKASSGYLRPEEHLPVVCGQNSAAIRPIPCSIIAISKTPDVRWRQRFQSFQKALAQLSSAAREAFARGLIVNGDEWLAMIQARNRSSHTYNEKTANAVATAILSGFVKEFEAMRTRFTELEKQKS